MSALGNKIRALLEASGESPKDFAHRMGISEGYLNDIMHGKALDVVDRILDDFDQQIDVNPVRPNIPGSTYAIDADSIAKELRTRMYIGDWIVRAGQNYSSTLTIPTDGA